MRESNKFLGRLAREHQLSPRADKQANGAVIKTPIHHVEAEMRRRQLHARLLQCCLRVHPPRIEINGWAGVLAFEVVGMNEFDGVGLRAEMELDDAVLPDGRQALPT